MSPLSDRANLAITGCAGVAFLAVGAFIFFGGTKSLLHGGGAVDPDAAMPRDAFLVASANVAELRKSPLWDVLFSNNPDTSVLDRKTLGLQRLSDACGFDPLMRVEKLSVGVPENGDKGDLDVAAHVTATPAELEKCTSALTSGADTKETVNANGFSIVGSDGPRVGYGHDLLVAGKGKWFDLMLATADGKNPSMKTSEQHAAMRSYLTARNGWGAPSMIVSAVLPASLRDRIKGEIASANGDPNTAQSTMAGVLGVSGVGVALKAGAKGGSIEAAAELVCDTEDACAGVEKLVEKKRFEWSKEIMLRMVGLGPLLDSITVKRDGTKVLVTAAAPAEQLAATLDRVMRFQGSRRGTLDMGPPPTLPSRKADEQIAAPKPAR